MDMRRIDAPDESYDVVWSACALEHVDTPADLERVLSEVARVLRPGGVHVLTTEWKLWGGFSYFPNCFIFDRPLLERTTKRVKLEPIGPVDLTFSPLHPLNTPVWRGLRPVFDQMPHVVLFSRGVLHTSMSLAFRKSSRAGHVLDFIGEDPGTAEAMHGRFRRMKETIGSPLSRARLFIDATFGPLLAAAKAKRGEWRGG
jgi:SAM-dependent methyltransferase